MLLWSSLRIPSARTHSKAATATAIMIPRAARSLSVGRAPGRCDRSGFSRMRGGGALQSGYSPPIACYGRSANATISHRRSAPALGEP